MDRIGDLNLFLRVLDLGSISAAARSLDLSVATASLRLKRLEKSLGARLFHRTTRRLRLTTEGTALVEQGRSLIEDLDALTEGLQSATAKATGTLRASIPASFGRQYISPLVPEFISRYPHVRLHVDLDDRVRDLAGEGFDVAIRIGALRDSRLVARRLAPNRRVLCASPHYLKQHGMPMRPEHLADHDCLVLVGDRGASNVWTLRKRGGREVSVRVGGRLESNLGEVIRDGAVAGLGIALHSTWHVCEDLKAGRLKVVLPDYSPPESGIYAVMLQRRLVPLRARAFVEFLAEHFSGAPPWERGPGLHTSGNQRR